MPDTGQALVVTPGQAAAQAAALAAAAQAAIPALTGLQVLNNHFVGTTATGGTVGPGAVPLIGDVTGTNTAAVAARSRPAWVTLPIVAGTPAQVPPGYAIVDLTGDGLLAVATVKLPASPFDRDTVWGQQHAFSRSGRFICWVS